MSRGDKVESNCFLVDWLSFRCKSMDLYAMIEYLGLKKCSFTTASGFYGYRFREWSEGISIHYGNEKVEGVLVEMSGKGCRAFEEFSEGNDWVTIFDDILHDDDYVVTRIDIAFDDHEGVIPIKKLFRDVGQENFVSRFKSTSITREDHPGKCGQTIYLGSCQSEIRYRIYDKAYERGITDGSVHWIRFEMQARRDMAYNFIRDLVKMHYNVGQLYAEVLSNYFRVVVPPRSGDSRKRRWGTAPYWHKLLGDVLPRSLWERKDTEYNRYRCESYVYGQAGNSVWALIQMDGLQKFQENLMKKKPSKIPDRIKNLVETEKMKNRFSDQAHQNGDAILSVIGECAS